MASSSRSWAGPAIAAAAAGAAALPGLRLPFLADDWGHLAAVASGVVGQSPWGYFRPLCALTYWVDWRTWGLNPAPFHATGLVLAAWAAALVVVLIRRYTRDAALAGMAGLLFALHPYHVENVAWIAARSDLLSGLLVVCAAIAYDRWRERARGLPLATLVLFEAALLAKESAIVLPAVVWVVAVSDRNRRWAAGEWWRGHAALLGAGLVHFLLVRPLALGDVALEPLRSIGAWPRRLLFFATSSVVPVQTEHLESRPLLWGAVAVLVTGGLLVLARVGRGRIPPVIWPAALAFVVLLGPSLISFQQRFLFLPSAAAALALAALLRANGPALGRVLAGLLVLGWSLAAIEHWQGWQAAGRASTRLVGDLVQASSAPGVREIVVAAVPLRVHGAPVLADLAAAVGLSGGGAVVVRSATQFDYRTDRDDALAAPRETAIRRWPEGAEVRLRNVDGVYSGYIAPSVPANGGLLEENGVTIAHPDPGTVRVEIRAAGGRTAYVWAGGRLVPLVPDAL